MRMLIAIPGASVDQVWPNVWEALQRSIIRSGCGESLIAWREACKRGRGHILMLLVDGEEMLGAIILQANVQQCALHCVALSGPRGLLRHVDFLVSEWKRIAYDHGYDRITLKGRRGWQRILERHGFELRNDGYLESGA